MSKTIKHISKVKNFLKELLPKKVQFFLIKLYNLFFKIIFYNRPPVKPSNYKRYLSLQVGKYLSHESKNKKWMEGQIRYLEREFQSVARNKFILDISCGDGVGLKNFKKMGFNNVTGVDFSHEKIEIATKIGYPVFQADFHNLSFLKNENFDIVYSSHSLEHALYPKKVLLEFKRILKKDGILKLVLPYPDRGPIDVHVAKIELGTNRLDKGKFFRF